MTTPQLLNKGIPARDVWGGLVPLLDEKLAAATEFGARLRAVSRALLAVGGFFLAIFTSIPKIRATQRTQE